MPPSCHSVLPDWAFSQSSQCRGGQRIEKQWGSLTLTLRHIITQVCRGEESKTHPPAQLCQAPCAVPSQAGEPEAEGVLGAGQFRRTPGGRRANRPPACSVTQAFHPVCMSYLGQCHLQSEVTSVRTSAPVQQEFNPWGRAKAALWMSRWLLAVPKGLLAFPQHVSAWHWVWSEPSPMSQVEPRHGTASLHDLLSSHCPCALGARTLLVWHRPHGSVCPQPAASQRGLSQPCMGEVMGEKG